MYYYIYFFLIWNNSRFFKNSSCLFKSKCLASFIELYTIFIFKMAVFGVFFLRWKNWWVRGILTLAMISFFFFIIYLGPMVLMMIVSINKLMLMHKSSHFYLPENEKQLVYARQRFFFTESGLLFSNTENWFVEESPDCGIN